MSLLKELLAERADDYVKGAAKEAGNKARETGERIKKAAADVVEKGRQASFEGEIGKAIRKLVALVKQREGLHESQVDEVADLIVEMLHQDVELEEGVLDFIKGAASEVGKKVKDKVKKVGQTLKDINDAGKKASAEGNVRRQVERDTKKAEADATKRRDLDAKIRDQAKKCNDLLRKRAATSGKKFKPADIKNFVYKAAGDDAAVAKKVISALSA